MRGGAAMASIAQQVATARERLEEATAGASVLWRHPAALQHWATASWPAWTALALVAILGVWVVPPAAESLAQWMFPPLREKRLLGLIYTRETDPRSAWAYGALLGTWWTAGLGAVAVLLGYQLRRLPEASRAQARALFDRARRLLAQDPLASLKLLDRAAALPADDELREAIDTARQSLLGRLSAESRATLVMDTAQGTSARPPTRPSVGPDGRYAIEGELGRGAMGVVYRARDTVLDRTVALKALPPAASARTDLTERFRQEARAAARLTHPGIVQVFDFITTAQGSFIVLERVDGEPLDDILARRGPLPVAGVLGYALPLAEALDSAHRNGVVHRDFKPANVLVTAAGQPKITDFGVAKVSGSSLATVAGSLFGSPAYMSPEQAAGGEVDHRADQYAFGAVLYHMLGGRPPFEGDMAEVLRQQISTPPPPLERLRPDLTEPLRALVHRLLAKDPGQRLDSMAAVADALRAAAAAG